MGKNLGVPTILMTWGSRSAEELRRTDPKAVLADNAAALEALLTERLSWLQEEWGDCPKNRKREEKEPDDT